MICGNHEILERYVAGQSSPEEAEDVRRHLDDCHACAQAVETLRQPRLESFTPFASVPLEEHEPPAGLQCPSTEELRAHLEGTLPLDRRAEVRDHLAECDACFERMRLLRQGLTGLENGVDAHDAAHTFFPEPSEETAAAEAEAPAEDVLTPAGISGFRQFLSHAAVAAAAVAVAVTVSGSSRRPTPAPRVGPQGGMFSAPTPAPGGSGSTPGGRFGGSDRPSGPGTPMPGSSSPGDRPGGSGPGGLSSPFGSPPRPLGPGPGLNSPGSASPGSGGTPPSTPTPRPTPPGGTPGANTPGATPAPRPATPAPPPGPPPAVVMETVLPIRRPGAGGTSSPPPTPATVQKAIQDAAEAARSGGGPAGIQKLQEFIQRNPEAPAEVQALLGTFYLKAGDRDRAGQAFAEAAKRLQPPAPPTPPTEPAPGAPPAAAPGTP